MQKQIAAAAAAMQQQAQLNATYNAGLPAMWTKLAQLLAANNYTGAWNYVIQSCYVPQVTPITNYGSLFAYQFNPPLWFLETGQGWTALGLKPLTAAQMLAYYLAAVPYWNTEQYLGADPLGGGEKWAGKESAAKQAAANMVTGSGPGVVAGYPNMAGAFSSAPSESFLDKWGLPILAVVVCVIGGVAIVGALATTGAGAGAAAGAAGAAGAGEAGAAGAVVGSVIPDTIAATVIPSEVGISTADIAATVAATGSAVVPEFTAGVADAVASTAAAGAATTAVGTSTDVASTVAEIATNTATDTATVGTAVSGELPAIVSTASVIPGGAVSTLTTATVATAGAGASYLALSQAAGVAPSPETLPSEPSMPTTQDIQQTIEGPAPSPEVLPAAPTLPTTADIGQTIAETGGATLPTVDLSSLTSALSAPSLSQLQQGAGLLKTVAAATGITGANVPATPAPGTPVVASGSIASLFSSSTFLYLALAALGVALIASRKGQ